MLFAKNVFVFALTIPVGGRLLQWRRANFQCGTETLGSKEHFGHTGASFTVYLHVDMEEQRAMQSILSKADILYKCQNTTKQNYIKQSSCYFGAVSYGRVRKKLEPLLSITRLSVMWIFCKVCEWSISALKTQIDTTFSCALIQTPVNYSNVALPLQVRER